MPTLNPEQQLAVNTLEGYISLQAGPGSGKTTVLVERYHKLRETGVKPEDILCLTFTAKAAQNMAKRAGKAVKDHVAIRPSGFMTFHSLALSFVTQERSSFPFRLAHAPLALPGQVTKIVGTVIRRYPGLKFKDFLSYISAQKRDDISPVKAIQDAMTQRQRDAACAYGDYSNNLKQNGLLDFDDLLVWTVKLLSEPYRSELYKRWQYEHIMVDESQDADKLQWQAVKLMSEWHKNLFCVGDCNQAVYEWRSAHPELFLGFKEMFPGAKEIFLGHNYRSTKRIVGLVRESAPVRNELVERFKTDNEEGEDIQVIPYGTSTYEAESTVKTIKDDTGAESTAILARTNFYLREFEDEMSRLEVPYRLLGKSGYWSQPEVRSVLAFVQCASSPSDSAVLSAIRAPFNCGKFIRKKELIASLPKKEVWTAINSHHSYDAQQDRSINGLVLFLHGLRKYRNQHASTAVPNIITDLKALEYYQEEEESANDNNPVENIKQLSEIANRFSTLEEFLEYTRKASHASKSRKGVALGTVHSAKGLEFDNVFVAGCQEGVIPHKSSDNLEEEARIFFVAISRAAKRLFISYVGAPSRFIERYVEKDATISVGG